MNFKYVHKDGREGKGFITWTALCNAIGSEESVSIVETARIKEWKPSLPENGEGGLTDKAPYCDELGEQIGTFYRWA